MIRILHCKNQACRTDIQPAQLPALLQQKQGILWVDLDGEPQADCERLLKETFGFHSLAVDDALSRVNVPKLDDWQEFVYVVLHGATYHPGQSEVLSLPELDVFLSKQHIVTYHERPLAVLEGVWDACQRNTRLIKGGADHLLYLLADELVKDHMTAVIKMQDSLEEVQDEIFSNPDSSTLERLFGLKRSLLQLRRIIAPQRDVFSRLTRDDYAIIDPKDRVFFRDVYDHSLQLYDLLEDTRELVSSALDTYLSVVNNRMNDVMKTLTIITTLFMPLTFITGFFGMNFFQAAEATEFWTGTVTLEIALVCMIVIPAIMFWWMRRRSWM